MTSLAKPIRVLYCESSADGTIGGSHYCLLNLVRKLDRTKFDPLVIFYDENKVIDKFRATAETMVHKQDAPVRWSGPARHISRGINAAKFAGAVASHVALLRRHDIKLVHLNNSITRHQDWMVAAFVAGIPCIVHERGLNRRYSFIDRAIAKRLAAIIPMSGWIKDHMVERGVPDDNIRVFYDGLDPSLLVPKISPEQIRQQLHVTPAQRVFGIVGNVREWKGQETVVSAVIEAVKTFPDLVCLIVGATATPADEAYKAKLQQQIAAAGIDANVRFTGYQAEVPSFMNAMEFVIHASVEPEPFGLVVLEAMAQRKAVIGSRAGGVIEMVVEGQTGYTFEPRDAGTLAKRIVDLLSDRELSRRMGEAGYVRLLKDFTMSRYMEQIYATYQSALDGQPLPSEPVTSPT